MIDQSYPIALRRASDEAFEGSFTENELEVKFDTDALKADALERLIVTRK